MNTLKTNIQNLAMLSAVISFASCQSHKQEKIENGTEIVKIRTPKQDTLDAETNPASETRAVSGKVTSVSMGKDGYTARIETAAGKVYFATVSHSNLNDASQFRTVKEGEEISVSGDGWKLDGDEQITVRELH